MGKKSRLWCGTNFNLELDWEAVYKTSSAQYIAYSTEIAPTTGKEHHQFYIYFEGQRGSIKGVAKTIWGDNIQGKVFMCKGNLDQNEDYCSKDGKFVEIGVKPTQGKRKDLDELKDDIMNGKVSVDEIAVSAPNSFHQYGRTLSKIEDIALRRKSRSWMTEGIWLTGPSGCGKSHRAFAGFDPKTHYVYPDDNGWWDGYTGQEVVIFNEFRGNVMTFSRLLDLCDKWPTTVRRRCREPVPFLAKKIIVTSVLRPNECYPVVFSDLSGNDRGDQLLRRFRIVEVSRQAASLEPFLDQKCSEGNTETSEPFSDEFLGRDISGADAGETPQSSPLTGLGSPVRGMLGPPSSDVGMCAVLPAQKKEPVLRRSKRLSKRL
jgi:hypothetical protein